MDRNGSARGQRIQHPGDIRPSLMHLVPDELNAAVAGFLLTGKQALPQASLGEMPGQDDTVASAPLERFIIPAAFGRLHHAVVGEYNGGGRPKPTRKASIPATPTLIFGRLLF
ncbi:hypothetical protein LJK87_24535 [Paenibacillus sp. P25]|nr:hypothetical protein LJK87_24535 [Paenibacillus sp. P25]